MGAVMYSFHLNVSPEVSRGVLECDVVSQSDMPVICSEEGRHLCWAPHAM